MVVTGACGSVASQTAALTVNGAPSLTVHPIAQTVCPGGSAIFTAAASGNPAPTVQWQASSDSGENYQELQGAQSTTLSINNVSAAQSGLFYRAVFTNACGTGMSAPALLTVHSFALVPTAQNFAASGGSGVVAVSIGGACPRTAASNAPWLAITAGASGNGTGLVNYTVAANAGPSRSGSLMVAGLTFTVTQDSGCAALTLVPAALPIGTVDANYSQTIMASGGAPAYQFTLASGALPAGLSLATNGTLSGAPIAAGVFSFTINTTDANGCTGAQTYAMTINTRPTINAMAATRQQGSPGSIAAIAHVSDAEQAANTLTVSINGGISAMVSGVTVSALGIGASGEVAANVVAACGATAGSFTLAVTDGAGATATATLMVAVTANAEPTLTYDNQTVLSGGSLTINPATGPADNGSVVSVTVQSSGSYTGALSVNPATGAVSISNAAPVGAHTITIRAIDNCGAAIDAAFTITVNNHLPAIIAGGAFARQQGSVVGAAVTIATVSDVETAAGSLAVTAGILPTGIAIGSIFNSNGIITATLTAGCDAGLGNNTIMLTVTDGHGGTATAALTVNVSGNSAPALNYAGQSVAAGGSLTVNPATGPSDNGSVVSITVQSSGNYTGAVSVNQATGAVSIGNAAPGRRAYDHHSRDRQLRGDD